MDNCSKKFILSVPESYVLNDPYLRLLSTEGDRLLGRDKETIYVGKGDDSRCYYSSPASELEEAIATLICRLPYEADVKIQRAVEANIPEILRSEKYNELARELERARFKRYYVGLVS